MDLLNCKKGMKVTTVGRTERGTDREDSSCCNREAKVGYIEIKRTFRYREKYLVQVGHADYDTDFKPDNVHPYWGDKRD
jgi:hypothetical protein